MIHKLNNNNNNNKFILPRSNSIFLLTFRLILYIYNKY